MSDVVRLTGWGVLCGVAAGATPAVRSAPAAPAALPLPAAPAGATERGMNVLPCSAMAPCTIHLWADVGEKALFTRYAWDFGDPGSPHNALVGFNAAHFYQKPGKYVITLTRTDDTGERTFTSAIEIAPDRRRHFFVSSSSGNDSANGLSEAAAFRTAARAAKAVTDDSAVYFKRGDVFDLAAGLSVDKRNVVLGAYGDTDQPVPVLRKAVAGLQELVVTRERSADVVVRDLCFDSAFAQNTDKIGAARGIWAAGQNVTAHDVEFRNVSDAVNAERKPRGVLIEDCRCPMATSLRAYFLWGQGEDLVVVGNTAGNSTREHIVRIGGADRVLIADNDFANVDRRQDGDPQDIAKGTLVLQKGSYFYAVGNTLGGRGGTGVGPLGGKDGVRDPGARAKWVVFEGNRMSEAGSIPAAGCEHVMYRNNLLRIDDVVALSVRPVDETKRDDGRPAYPGRTIADLWFVHNTVINHAKNGRFLNVEGDAAPGGIAVIGNLYVAPNWETGYNDNAAVMVTKVKSPGDLSGFSAIAHNVWPVPAKSNPPGAVNYVYPMWFDPAGYLTMAQWLAKRPPVDGDVAANVAVDETTGAPAKESAAARRVPPVPGVFADVNGKARPADGPRTAGAVEVGGE